MNKRQVAIVPNNIGRYIKNGRDLRVYIAIISHRNSKTKECFPGRKRIAELTGIDESAISRSLTRLENGGFIQRKKRYNNSNEYLFTSIDEIEAIYNEHSGGDTNCHIESDGKHNIDNDTIDHIGSDVLQHTNKEVNIEVNIKDKVISKHNESAPQIVTENTLPTLSLIKTIYDDNLTDETTKLSNSALNNQIKYIDENNDLWHMLSLRYLHTNDSNIENHNGIDYFKNIYDKIEVNSLLYYSCKDRIISVSKKLIHYKDYKIAMTFVCNDEKGFVGYFNGVILSYKDALEEKMEMEKLIKKNQATDKDINHLKVFQQIIESIKEDSEKVSALQTNFNLIRSEYI